jgi:uncharacterized membrane protein
VGGCQYVYNDENSRFYEACYWENNGIAQYLSSVDSSAKDIAIADSGDIYIIGNIDLGEDETQACVWKKRTKIDLCDTSCDSEADAIAITADGDVYIAGVQQISTTGFEACYWKNGSKTPTIVDSNSSYISQTSGIVAI